MRSTPSWTCWANTASSTSADAVGLSPPSAADARRWPGRTHGYTRPGRLARLDAVLAYRERALLERTDGAFERAVWVDLGVGEWPWTTRETATCFATLNPSLRGIGVDADADRIRHARRVGGERLEFRLGDFSLPLTAAEPARLVRAMNVLREYREAEAERAHRTLAASLLPGGLLVEGTSSRSGGVLCAHLLRKRDASLEREALLFTTDFSQGFSPWLFRDRLPRDLRRHAQRGTAIRAFFDTWDDAFRAARTTGVREISALFALTALALSSRVAGIVLDPLLVHQGTLLWQPPHGVPSACVPTPAR